MSYIPIGQDDEGGEITPPPPAADTGPKDTETFVGGDKQGGQGGLPIVPLAVLAGAAAVGAYLMKGR